MRVSDDYYIPELRGRPVEPIRTIEGVGVIITKVKDWAGHGKNGDEWAFGRRELFDG